MIKSGDVIDLICNECGIIRKENHLYYMTKEELMAVLFNIQKLKQDLFKAINSNQEKFTLKQIVTLLKDEAHG